MSEQRDFQSTVEKYNNPTFIKCSSVAVFIYLVIFTPFILAEIIFDHMTVTIFRGYQLGLYVFLLASVALLCMSPRFLREVFRDLDENTNWYPLVLFCLFSFLFGLLCDVILLLVEVVLILVYLTSTEFPETGIFSKTILEAHVAAIFPFFILYDSAVIFASVKLYLVIAFKRHKASSKPEPLEDEYEIHIKQDSDENLAIGRIFLDEAVARKNKEAPDGSRNIKRSLNLKVKKELISKSKKNLT